MSLTLFDAIVFAVVLISAVLAMARGFVREVLSVASWVLAALAAFYFYDALLPLLEPYFSNQTIAIIISAAVIFFVALIVLTFITIKIADMVIDSRVGPVDRLLGFIFGAARGVLLLVIAFFFFTWLVPLADQPTWIANAQSRPILENLGRSLVAVLPDDIESTLLDRFEGDDAEGAAPVDAAETTEDPFEGLFTEEEQTPEYDQDSLDLLFNGGQQTP